MTNQHHRIGSRIAALTLVLAAAVVTAGVAGSRAGVMEVRDDASRLEPVFGTAIPLFDGRSLDGWRAHFRDGSADASQAWSLVVRRHEAVTHVCGVRIELQNALKQPRYAQRGAAIEAYMAEHPGVPTDGVVHNTGLLLWNQAPAVLQQTRALQASWYNATRSVTL